ncbi:Serine/threonine-protein kinase PknF [Planctomycetes bacterium Pan216]|uniref:Serine/threonine-protein kinase PknF n=1 Tax=Kolteria novifilia TaxID=2527975 RepID=A0A518B5J5_9BACT|nr:Serine/threonine-protein kinase PknF [Planctomycetes bacterium Pan216]
MALLIDVGTEPLPGYKLLKLLGEGGFGQVWKASAPGGVEVALKFIRMEDQKADPELRALHAIRNIRHPHLLDIHFAVQIDDRLVIATSLCDRSLWERFKECRESGLTGIPKGELLGYMRESASALDFLNEPRHVGPDGALVGIQHRDIKPQNIFLVGDSAKVADFGLAKVLKTSQASHTGSMTPWYTAPETFKSNVAFSSDQYSLVVTYFQLRCGKLPYQAGEIYQYIRSTMEEEPNLSPLPEEERGVVARALAKEPDQRWPNCLAFVEELIQRSETEIASRWRTRQGAPMRSVVGRDDATLSDSRLSGVGPKTPMGASKEDAATLLTAGQFETAGHASRDTVPESRADFASARSQIVKKWWAPTLVFSTVAAVTLPMTMEFKLPWQSEEHDPPPVVVIPHGEEDKETPSTGKHAGHHSETPTTNPSTADAMKPTSGAGTSSLSAKTDHADDHAQLKNPSLVFASATTTLPADRATHLDRTITNSVGMTLKLVLPGTFEMGSREAINGESPAKRITLNKAYYVGATEVTQGQWKEVMGTEPWAGQEFVNVGDDYPAVFVNWRDANEFCRRLSEKDGRFYRLPTEAEWEYASRSGTSTSYSFGDSERELEKHGWFNGNAGGNGEAHAHLVGRKLANGFGLHDMHGNVWEWCFDPFTLEHYDWSPALNLRGSFLLSDRACRGGSWGNGPADCRSTSRLKSPQARRKSYLGFRVVSLADDK